MADELPEPKSRKESYLAKAAGMDVTIPEKPESRLEQYLEAIADNGGGGGGGGPTVVQTTGTSTTDVMSQNATTRMVFGDPGTNTQVKIGAGAVVGGEGVAIGTYANGDVGNVSIGSTAGWGGSGVNRYRTCIGYHAGRQPGSSEKGSISLGAYSKTSATGEMNIGSTDTTYGYNNTNYRLLTGVHDPVDAHDAATKGYVDANAGGPTVVQTTGNSTTDVMSQKAAFGMIVADTSSSDPYDRVQIGGASKQESVSIGRNALANGFSVSVGRGAGFGSASVATYNTDIGYSAGLDKVSAVKHSVSLGSYSKATRAGEVNIGTPNNSFGYNNTSYRVIGGVHDGQLAQDAVTVNQVNSVIDAINTALSTNIPHIGAAS
jgi:hypothetical protein